MENTYTYSKHCCEFGRQCQFSDSPAELLVDIHPDPSLALNFSQKSHRDLATQTGVEMSEHEVNTKLHKTRSCGVNQKQTSLFRNKVEKDESYINSVLQLSPPSLTMMHAVWLEFWVDACWLDGCWLYG
uniref:Uncharacterized protein n=1 Tax=Maylandia zebra TaxID=106582 RepID=A0A3P9DJY5_9CICH